MAPRKLTLDDYIITEDGRIINSINGHERKPQLNNKGYLRVQIGGKNYFVHRLVAEKYVPNPDNKEQVNHIDGNKLNNCASNLEWVTNQENRNHAVKNKLHQHGEGHAFAKLDWEKVDYIREHMDISDKELSELFGVAPQTIYDVKYNRTWIIR